MATAAAGLYLNHRFDVRMAMMQEQVEQAQIAAARATGVVETQTQMNLLLDAIIADGEGKLTIQQMVTLRDVIWEQAALYAASGLTTSRILAIIRQESHFDPEAHSEADAYGLMQVTPDTALGHLPQNQRAALYTNPQVLWDIELNVRTGVAELMRLHGLYVARGLEELDDFRLTHTAYFWGYAGTNRLLAANGVNEPKPSLNYANSVIEHEREYREVGLQ